MYRYSNSPDVLPAVSVVVYFGFLIASDVISLYVPIVCRLSYGMLVSCMPAICILFFVNCDVKSSFGVFVVRKSGLTAAMLSAIYPFFALITACLGLPSSYCRFRTCLRYSLLLILFLLMFDYLGLFV